MSSANKKPKAGRSPSRGKKKDRGPVGWTVSLGFPDGIANEISRHAERIGIDRADVIKVLVADALRRWGPVDSGV